MTKQVIIERTLKAIDMLPEDKAGEICDFADFLIRRYEDNALMNGMGLLANNSQVFDFLKVEEDLYSEADIKSLTMAKGDIVLITFPFTDLSNSKLRPAVVLADTVLDLTVSFITTQIEWQEPTDLLLSPTSTNGLKKLSLIRTGKIATLDKTLVKGLLGKLNRTELLSLDNNLKLLFHLN